MLITVPACREAQDARSLESNCCCPSQRPLLQDSTAMHMVGLGELLQVHPCTGAYNSSKAALTGHL